jgi:hypothetical protein
MGDRQREEELWECNARLYLMPTVVLSRSYGFTNRGLILAAPTVYSALADLRSPCIMIYTSHEVFRYAG